MVKSDAGRMDIPTRAKQWLLPPEGTLFQLRGRQYQVTYVNYGKLRFAARFVQVMPEPEIPPRAGLKVEGRRLKVEGKEGEGERSEVGGRRSEVGGQRADGTDKESRGRRFWAAVKRGFGG